MKFLVLLVALLGFISTTFACVGTGAGCYAHTQYFINYVDWQGNNITKWLDFIQMPWGKQFITNYVDAQGNQWMKLRALIAPDFYYDSNNVKQSDPNRSGCFDLVKSMNLGTMDVPGSAGLTSYAGTAMFSYRGTCTTNGRTIAAAQAGSRVSIAINCNPDPPVFCQRGPSTGWSTHGLTPNITYISCASMGTDWSGDALIAQPLLKNVTDKIWVYFPASGPISDPNEFKFLKAWSAHFSDHPQYWFHYIMPNQYWNNTVGLVQDPWYKANSWHFNWLFNTAWWFQSIGRANEALTDPYFYSEDPCVGIRLASIICRNGHIVDVSSDIIAVNTGTFPVEFGLLSKLERFRFNAALLNGLIPSLKSTELWYIECTFCKGITGLPAAVAADIPNLQYFIVDLNKITALPSDLGSIPSLKYVSMNNNQIQSVPFLSNLASLPNLEYLDVSFNNINMPVPNFSGSQKLQTINLAQNKFYSSDITNYFNNLPKLQNLDVSFNQISGSLPNFINCTAIVNVNFKENKFVGGLPNDGKQWMFLSTLTVINLARNQLTGPFTFKYTNVQHFDASYNLIDFTKAYWKKLTNSEIWSGFVPTCLTTGIVSINLQANKIVGPWGTSNLNFTPLLRRIILQNNSITSVPGDLLGNNINYIDVSYNALTGDFASQTPYPTVEMLKFDGNPKLRYTPASKNDTSTIPNFLTRTSEYRQTSILDTFSCPTLKGLGDSLLVAVVDASYFSYEGCVCNRGYYGSAPNCISIPSYVPVADVGTVDNYASVSDLVYGNSRLSQGVDISWLIAPKIEPAAINVRVTLMDEFFISDPLYFDIPNKITVSDACYVGFNFNYKAKDCSCTNNQLYNKNTGKCEATTLTASYKQSVPILSYNPDSAARVVSTRIVNQFATVGFSSKKLGGFHFTVNVTLETQCDEGFLLYENSVNDGFIQSHRCEKVFKTSSGITYAAYAVIALFTIFNLVVTVLVVNKRNSLIIKAASFPFCFMMLICIVILCFGSVFYALQPSDVKDVCHLRPWFTALPLVAVLSALFVKANRIRKIFASKELVVQQITNAELAQTAGAMIGGELALLIGLSASGLVQPKYLLGSGAAGGYVTYVCDLGAKYNIWIALQFVYIAVFLFAGVTVAWSVRKVPSAFNEGPHIASCLLSTVVFLIILIPLNYLVDDNPDALVIIRSLGQVLVSTVMCFFLFGPKIYYILEGKENDKTLSSMGSSRSSQSFSGSSKSSSGGANDASIPMFGLVFKAIANLLEEYKTSGNRDTSSINSAFDSLKSAVPANKLVSIQNHIDTIKSFFKE